MPPYSYSPLDEASKEIRIMTLLPGEFEDPIRFTITHKPFTFKRKPLPTKVVTQEHEKSLPEGWLVCITLEGRFLYEYTDPSGSESTQWTHPTSDPRFQDDGDDDSIYFNSIGKTGYEALSYTWGSPDNPEIAYVETSWSKSLGITQRQTMNEGSMDLRTTLEVGPNLACALRNLRQKQPRTLWVDAICINQANIAERSAQVPRMDVIYNYADRVVAWLGPQLSTSKLAISSLDYLGSQIESARDIFMYLRSPEASQPSWYRPETPLPYDENTWQAIYDLLVVPWFERVWVMQEIQLANSKSILVCGTHHISWYRFRCAIIFILEKKGIIVPVNLSRTLQRIQRTHCMNLSILNFARLLAVGQSLKSTNSLDKIYGLLGLAPLTISRKICPNYLLAAGEVYKDVFLLQMSSLSRLEMFGSSSHHLESRLPDTPSWVPNLGDSSLGTFHFAGFKHGECSTGLSSCNAKYLPPNILVATGVQCATLSTIEPLMHENSPRVFGIFKVIGLQRLLSDTYPTGESLLTACAWTVSLNQIHERSPSHRRYLHLGDLMEKIIRQARSQFKGGEESADLDRIKQGISNCRFFSTLEGYIGFGPRSSQAGDIVCTLLGCRAPLLLRKTGNMNFEVVGICWVYGIMDGESVLGPLPSPWKVRLPLPRYASNMPAYWNPETGVETFEDPRLGPLPHEWESVEQQQTSDDPSFFAPHRNKATGKVINSDPRLFPEALIAKGVKLQEFQLI